eukprot:4501299-Lingulodinium_polyedra.AAC.1
MLAQPVAGPCSQVHSLKPAWPQRQSVTAGHDFVEPGQAVPGSYSHQAAQQAMSAALGFVGPGQAVPGPCLHQTAPQAVSAEA